MLTVVVPLKEQDVDNPVFALNVSTLFSNFVFCHVGRIIHRDKDKNIIYCFSVLCIVNFKS